MKRTERGISLIVLVIAIVLMAVLVAVGVILIINKNDVKVDNKKLGTEEILTERQKEILTEQGLSINYEDLTYRQQKTITNIEKALTYLENKYPERTFEYKGYEIPYIIAKYEIVYINEEENQDVIEVEVYNDGSIADNFDSVLLKNKNSDIILKEAKSLLNNKEDSVRIFSADGVSSFYLFINNEVVSEEKYFEFVKDIKEFVIQNEILCSCRVSLVDGNTFVYLTKYNFSDFYKNYIQDESFYNNGN